MNRTFFLHVIILTVFLMSACSSPPKNKGDILTLRNHAEAGLEAGNREAGRGDYERALIDLAGSKKNAILTDDPSLIIRCCLSLGNVYFEVGMTDDAFKEWEQAIAEAEKTNDDELLAVSRIYHARGMLLSGRASAQTVLDEINGQQQNIKKNRFYTAFSFQAKSLALRALSSYAEAENALMESLKIHENDLYLEDASYDWYSIASLRSVNGNYEGAVKALEESIKIDRRIENSWGLSASYRAMGDVYRRMGNRYDQEAREAYNRAIEIYRALGNTVLAEETRNRMENN